MVHMDHKTCSAALADLYHEGLITMRAVGRARLYGLKRDFPLIEEVLRPLFEWERKLPERLSDEIRTGLGTEALSVLLYGSTAKGTDRGNSDIDVLVVAPDKGVIERLEAKVDQLLNKLLKGYGRVLSAHVIDLREFRAMHAEKNAFLREVLRTGTLLHGLREEDLLNHGRKENRRRTGAPRTIRRKVVPRPWTARPDEGSPGST